MSRTQTLPRDAPHTIIRQDPRPHYRGVYYAPDEAVSVMYDLDDGEQNFPLYRKGPWPSGVDGTRTGPTQPEVAEPLKGKFGVFNYMAFNFTVSRMTSYNRVALLLIPGGGTAVLETAARVPMLVRRHVYSPEETPPRNDRSRFEGLMLYNGPIVPTLTYRYMTAPGAATPINFIALPYATNGE
jgi:hypothetical protein